MKTKKIKDLDLEVYFEKLYNGLEVYIIPSNNVNNTYVTYSAKYGGMHNEFYVNDEKVTVPMGIAHFLEHKMFETEDGVDVFNFFQERGSNCNANTNSKKTTYLFSGPNAFYENLEYLLSYVESPYFTDENVNKEKGIIEQEIMMYKDNPYSRMYEDLMYNLFVNHPLKYPTIGTKESINKITKEDLYTCYNAFYHPSNMFVVVTGNVDPKKTMELIKKHERYRVEITDTGMGIKKEDLNRIWDRYYKIDKSGKRRVAGTGIGLAIVKQILSAHEALLGVDSEYGHGATFYFEMYSVEYYKKEHLESVRVVDIQIDHDEENV